MVSLLTVHVIPPKLHFFLSSTTSWWLSTLEMPLLCYFSTLAPRLTQLITRFFSIASRITVAWLTPQSIGFARTLLIALKLSESRVNFPSVHLSSLVSLKELFWALLPTLSTPTHNRQSIDDITCALTSMLVSPDDNRFHVVLCLFPIATLQEEARQKLSESFRCADGWFSISNRVMANAGRTGFLYTSSPQRWDSVERELRQAYTHRSKAMLFTFEPKMNKARHCSRIENSKKSTSVN